MGKILLGGGSSTQLTTKKTDQTQHRAENTFSLHHKERSFVLMANDNDEKHDQQQYLYCIQRINPFW